MIRYTCICKQYQSYIVLNIDTLMEYCLNIFHIKKISFNEKKKKNPSVTCRNITKCKMSVSTLFYICL